MTGVEVRRLRGATSLRLSRHWLRRARQAQQRLAVQLADAGFGDVDDLADFAQVQLFVVVQGHDQLFAWRQFADGHRQCRHERGLFDGVRTAWAALSATS